MSVNTISFALSSIPPSSLVPMLPAFHATKRDQEDGDISGSELSVRQKVLNTRPYESTGLSESIPSFREDMSLNGVDLCRRCASLDMDEILSTEARSLNGRRIMDLGSPEAPNFDLSCSLCCLLYSMQPDGKRSHQLHPAPPSAEGLDFRGTLCILVRLAPHSLRMASWLHQPIRGLHSRNTNLSLSAIPH